MKYSEAKHGRVFVIRLEDGEIVHEVIERFARAKRIRAASVLLVGGADAGSKLVVGPARGRATPIKPMTTVLANVYEIAGVGTIFPDDRGAPVLHLHAACGRKRASITGCIRAGVRTWQVIEAIVTELKNCHAARLLDPVTGFKLLQPQGNRRGGRCY